jgi:hypothetical protein
LKAPNTEATLKSIRKAVAAADVLPARAERASAKAESAHASPDAFAEEEVAKQTITIIINV